MSLATRTLDPSVIDLPAGIVGRKNSIRMTSSMPYMMTFLYSDDTTPAASVSTTPTTRPPTMVPTMPKPPIAAAAKALMKTACPIPNDAKNSGAISTPGGAAQPRADAEGQGDVNAPVDAVKGGGARVQRCGAPGYADERLLEKKVQGRHRREAQTKNPQVEWLYRDAQHGNSPSENRRIRNRFTAPDDDRRGLERDRHAERRDQKVDSSGALRRSIGRRISRSSRTPTTPVPSVATTKVTMNGLPSVANSV